MNDIFTYSDYREYLRDYYASKKAVHSFFSYRYMARKAQVNSSSFYKYVFDGTRNLTKSTILKTCIMLQLKDREAEYFENLVFFNQAATISEKNHYFDKIVSLRNVLNVKQVKPDQYDFYSAWYHPVIRELVVMVDFKNDYSLLARHLSPPITSAQAKDSVELLLKLGLITKCAEGKYTQADNIITSGPSVKALQVINCQIAMLQLAQQAWDRFSGEERSMGSTTLSISEKTFKLFVKKSRQFRSELLEIARLDEKPERVFHLNMNLFPVSAKTGVRHGK
jgi:uncharacterized protein (TIGR02147 family)